MLAGSPGRWPPRTSLRGRSTLSSCVALLLVASVSIAGDATPQHGDPAARLSPAPAATEYWDLTARFDGGYRLFERFVITNEGPGKQTAAAVGYVVHPDGHVSEFRNGRRHGEWKLSPDRLRIDVASSALDLHAPVRRLQIDSNNQKVKIDLRFPARAAPDRHVDPGIDAFRSDLLEMSAPIEGTMWLGGMPAPRTMRGTAALTHAWMDERESSLVQRRIEFVGGRSDLALYLSDITTPTKQHRGVLAVERSSAPSYQTSDFDLVLEPATPATADRKFPVPGRLLIHNADVTVSIHPERPLLRANPLDVVPQPFRFLLARQSAPQRLWFEATFHLELAGGTDRAPLAADGEGILAVNFLNPLPLPN